MTIADTIKSLKPGDRVRVVHEVVVVVGPDYDGDVLVEDDYYLIHDDPTITFIEVIERPLQVGDRVTRSPAMSDATRNGFGVILAISGDDVWVRWEDGKFTPIQRLNWLRRAS